MGHALFIFVNDVVTKDILAKEEQCLEISKLIIYSECSRLQHITYNYHYYYYYYNYFHYYCFALGTFWNNFNYLAMLKLNYKVHQEEGLHRVTQGMMINSVLPKPHHKNKHKKQIANLHPASEVGTKWSEDFRCMIMLKI